MLNPQAVDRTELALEAQAFLDRLSGAPVRIVRNNTAPAKKAKPEKAEIIKAPKTKKEEIPGQMDIEDLFGTRA